MIQLPFSREVIGFGAAAIGVMAFMAREARAWLKSPPKPVVNGVVSNVPAAVVNTSTLTYQAIDAPAEPPDPGSPPPEPTPEPSPAAPDPGPEPELPMSLNIAALASRVAAVGVTAAQAVRITNEVVQLIGIVEDLYEGITGSAKFQAVMSGLDAIVEQLGLTDKLHDIRSAVAPLINVVVGVLNSGNLWAKVFGSIANFADEAAKQLQSLAGNQTPAAAQGA